MWMDYYIPIGALTVMRIPFSSSPVASGKAEHRDGDEDGQDDVSCKNGHDWAHVYQVTGATIWRKKKKKDLNQNSTSCSCLSLSEKLWDESLPSCPSSEPARQKHKIKSLPFFSPTKLVLLIRWTHQTTTPRCRVRQASSEFHFKDETRVRGLFESV